MSAAELDSLLQDLRAEVDNAYYWAGLVEDAKASLKAQARKNLARSLAKIRALSERTGEQPILSGLELKEAA